MKKIILTIFVCLFFTAFASAQTEYQSAFTAGVKAGADYSSFPSYTGFTNNGKVGYIAGFWGNLNLGSFFYFEPEIYAIEKRVDVTFGQGDDVYSENSKYTTLDVPLLLGAKFGDQRFNVRIYTGPALSLAISKVQSFTQDNIYPQRLNYTDENVSWQFGAGITAGKFTIDARYEAGITKVGYGDGINPTTGVQTSSTHLNIISLTVGYTLFASDGGFTYQ